MSAKRVPSASAANDQDRLEREAVRAHAESDAPPTGLTQIVGTLHSTEKTDVSSNKGKHLAVAYGDRE